eukprot:scaffold1734_cov113-Isochrysis_galbana.AAC.13
MGEVVVDREWSVFRQNNATVGKVRGRALTWKSRPPAPLRFERWSCGGPPVGRRPPQLQLRDISGATARAAAEARAPHHHAGVAGWARLAAWNQPPRGEHRTMASRPCRRLVEGHAAAAVVRNYSTDSPPCPPCLFAREKVPSVIVSYGPRSDDRYVGAPSALRLYSLKRLELRFVYQSINQSQSCQSRHMSYASDHSSYSAASQPHSQDFTQSTPSRQSGMVQPVIQEMYATVHAAGSSLFGLFKFMYNLRFDSTIN